MCVIYACHEKLPSDGELRAGAFRNSDGAGIAWLTGKGQVAWKKGLKSDADVVKDFISKNKISFPLAIHFRNASIGGVHDELTHPFPITEGAETDLEGEADALLMHNGHVHEWDKHFMHCLYNTQLMCPEGHWSDSRALAFLVRAKGEGILQFVGGRTGRVLVFRAEMYPGRNKKHADRFFKIYGDWHNDESGHKDGFYQSINIDTWARNQVSGKGSGTTASGGADNSSTSRSTSPRQTTNERHGPGRQLTEHSSRSGSTTTTSRWPENSWTLDELEEVTKALEEEQDHARRLVGG
jgi:hypothetical protein